MARLNVNPTRMQLKTLKNRLKVATKGHKLLKDKCDEMVRRYIVLVKKNYSKRLAVEDSIRKLLTNFCLSKGYMSPFEVSSAFLLNSSMNIFETLFEEESIMNVVVPNISIIKNNQNASLPYSYINSNAEFAKLQEECLDIVPKLIELSKLEKTCQILANEIEHAKRRVNALEFVMIPQLEETIKYISMKIEENDRTSRIRLIKVKSMIENRKSN